MPGNVSPSLGNEKTPGPQVFMFPLENKTKSQDLEMSATTDQGEALWRKQRLREIVHNER